MDSFQKIAYIMLESKIDSVLINIKKNKNTAIKEYAQFLLKLGEKKVSPEINDILINIINDDNSPYYILVNNLFNDTNYQSLRRVFLNIGYLFLKNNFQSSDFIPRNIIFELNDLSELTMKELSLILYQAESFGIYTAEFHLEFSNLNLRKLINMLASHTNSIYLLYLEEKHINQQIIIDLLNANNIILCYKVNSRGDVERGLKTINLLRQRKCFFGVYTIYNNSNIAFITQGDYLKLMGIIRTPFTILIKDENYHDYSNVSHQINKYNFYPFLIVDYYDDIKFLSSKFNMKTELIKIIDNGKISINGQIIADFNIKYDSLESILK